MNDRRAEVHVVNDKTYALVWIGLVVLTGTTVTVAGIDLGVMNIVAALLIASMKAGLVLAFFMHLKYEKGVFRVMIFVALVTLVIIIGLTFADIYYRLEP